MGEQAPIDPPTEEERAALWARRSLHADAAYCGLAGLAVLLSISRIASPAGLPPALLRAAGAITLAWAGLLFGLSRTISWRPAIAAVATANTGAAIGLAALALTRRHRIARATIAAVSLEVGAFAAHQWALLGLSRRGPGDCQDGGGPHDGDAC